GGITTRQEIEAQAGKVDGVMIGRAAYHNPWVLADAGKTRAEVAKKMASYSQSAISSGYSLRNITRHMLGLYHATPRARLWRRMLSDAALLQRNDPGLILQALDAVESGGSMMMAA
ncbi:MAG TPA: tRNA-dihydrouridine synthase, partial [Burkholderiales bacterium]